MSSPTFNFVLDASTQAAYTAPTRQQPANLRGLIRTGKVLMGAVLSYPSRHVAKTLAVTGADWIWIDSEHVAWPLDLLAEVIQIINHESGGRMVPIVRVPSKTAFDYMTYCLDAGAGGIIIPHIETVEEVVAIVSACRFPPVGHRSFPPFSFVAGVTDATPDGETVYSLANKHVSIIPQIESPLGIRNIGPIMQMEEIDACMIGAGDLRLELGLPLGFMGDEPSFAAAMDHASEMARKHNKALVGAALAPAMIEERLRQGFKLLISTIDLYVLAGQTIGQLATARESVEAYMSEHSS